MPSKMIKLLLLALLILKAGQTVQRRFTRIWKKEAGTWRLFARHANVLPPR